MANKNDASSKQTPPELGGMTAEQLEQLAQDESGGEGAAVLREVARLQLENKTLKARNLRVWSALGVTVVLLVVTFFSVARWYPKYRYIATTNNAAICSVTPEAAPRVTPASVADYAKDAVVNAYSYDYVNYRDTLNSVGARWFTDSGRKAFLASLDESGNLKRVILGRYVLRAMSTRAPQLEEESSPGTQRRWIVQVPIAIEFYTGGDANPKSRQDFLATVTVVHEPASETNRKGIAVDSISLSPYTRK
jgi:intracellular multiplication protein IcmL